MSASAYLPSPFWYNSEPQLVNQSEANQQAACLWDTECDINTNYQLLDMPVIIM